MEACFIRLSRHHLHPMVCLLPLFVYKNTFVWLEENVPLVKRLYISVLGQRFIYLYSIELSSSTEVRWEDWSWQAVRGPGRGRGDTVRQTAAN